MQPWCRILTVVQNITAALFFKARIPPSHYLICRRRFWLESGAASVYGIVISNNKKVLNCNSVLVPKKITFCARPCSFYICYRLQISQFCRTLCLLVFNTCKTVVNLTLHFWEFIYIFNDFSPCYRWPPSHCQYCCYYIYVYGALHDYLIHSQVLQIFDDRHKWLSLKSITLLKLKKKKKISVGS